MLTRLELKELASGTLDGANFVTLYLNLDPTQVKRDDLQLHFKNLIRTISQPDKSLVARDIEKIERFLADHPEGLKRGLAIISSSARDFWWIYPSALPFHDELVVQSNPYLKPLLTQLDQYQRYLVAVVGGELARLFVAGMGEMFEVTDFYRPTSDGNPSRDGGWGGMGGVREQRRKENTQHILYKDVAHAMDELLKREEIKRVLLGGADHSRGHFKEVLPESLSRKIVGEFHVDRNASVKEMLEKVLPAMKDVEYQFERRALTELFDRQGKDTGGVVGLPDVLDALQQGKIMKMYVSNDRTAGGMVCGSCAALTPVRDDPCPYCGAEMKSVKYMHDLAVRKALDQGVRVDMIEHSKELAQVGGIGALLRY